MNYLITGATSLIGKHLIRRLLSEPSNNIIAVVRNGEEARKIFPSKVHVFEKRIDQYYSIPSEINQHIDWVIPLAWESSSSKAREDSGLQKISYESTVQLIKTLTENDDILGVITPGSQMEYGHVDQFDSPYFEDVLCKPDSIYGQYKLMLGEACGDLCDKKGVMHFHPRIFSLYGQDDRPAKLINFVAKSVSVGKKVELKSDCRQMWNLLYIEDFIDVLMLFTKRKMACGIYNIGFPDSKRLNEYLDIMLELSGFKGLILYGKEHNKSDYMAPCFTNKILDTGLWYPKTTWETGAKSIIDYYSSLRETT